MDYDAVIVGAGMAGLTAAAYLCDAGLKVLVCEKENKVGGLCNSFEYNGFIFDGGIRAIENSGIVTPMLRQLGIDLKFIRNAVSIGIEQQVVSLKSQDSLTDYLGLLNDQFPENKPDIARIGDEIRKIMKYMDILYGIDNPIFLDLKNNTKYIFKTILPWLFKYIFTIRKINRLNQPVVEYLRQFSKNEVLIDLIAQHFFKATPTFFAMSYFSLYLDYQYPAGGTGSLSAAMKEYILDHKGEIRTGTEIRSLDPQLNQIEDSQGNVYRYRKLVWAADMKKLYQAVKLDSLASQPAKTAISAQKAAIADKIGGDSILTLYLTLDLDKQYFASKADAHFFYTPHKSGLSSMQPYTLNVTPAPGSAEADAEKKALFDWLSEFYEKTTFEISCPVLRDEKLAPPGKTGLIISALFDYPLARHISEAGWYDEFKAFSAARIIEVLASALYPEMKDKIIDYFISTPLTLEKLTGNSDGGITGWSFTNSFIPAVHSMAKIARSVDTPIPNVSQAGQWTFSPSGLPISILTGKLAADQVIKQLK